MDSLSINWRGMAGVGKRTLLVNALKQVAQIRGVPFSIQMRSDNTSSGDVVEAGATEEGAGPDSQVGQFMHETSLVHIGLDVARMSMQDKNIIRPIIAALGQGSQVLAGNQGRGHRLLVLYHAHLLSSESILLIHACLEQNVGDVSVWMTSELPVPQRIRDWFIEVPVAGTDRSFELYKGMTGGVNWPDLFRAIIEKWRSTPAKLHDIKEVKTYVYEMLMRNLRWVEATHFLLDVVLDHDGITAEQRGAALAVLSKCEATGGGYTIPSYRIPIIWESLFVQLRSIFALNVPPTVDGAARPRRAGKASKTRMGSGTTQVVSI
jgi:hypothetical protein